MFSGAASGSHPNLHTVAEVLSPDTSPGPAFHPGHSPAFRPGHSPALPAGHSPGPGPAPGAGPYLVPGSSLQSPAKQIQLSESAVLHRIEQISRLTRLHTLVHWGALGARSNRVPLSGIYLYRGEPFIMCNSTCLLQQLT